MLSRKHLDSQDLMLKIAGPRCKSHFIYMPSSNCSKCTLRTRTMDFKGKPSSKKSRCTPACPLYK